MMRLTLIRHGETVGQSSIRYYGMTDVPLSDAGREQMRRVRAVTAGERFAAAFTSRLRRSIEAAVLIVPDGPSPMPIAGFDEVSFGRWEGWTREEIAARDPVNYRLWQRSPRGFTYPEGESREIFSERVVTALRDLLKDSSDANVLLVLHKGVIAVVLSELLRLDAGGRARLAIELGSIHVAARGRDGTWRPEVIDRVDHLEASTAEQP